MEIHREPPKIMVIVRKRPISSNEIKKKDTDILEKRGEQTIVLKELK